MCLSHLRVPLRVVSQCCTGNLRVMCPSVTWLWVRRAVCTSVPKSMDCMSTSVECILLGWLAGWLCGQRARRAPELVLAVGLSIAWVSVCVGTSGCGSGDLSSEGLCVSGLCMCVEEMHTQGLLAEGSSCYMLTTTALHTHMHILTSLSSIHSL